MLRTKRFLAIIALFLFVVTMGSCGGGGGGSTGSTPPPPQLEGPTFDATAVDEDEFRTVVGSSTFTPPLKPLMITKDARSINLVHIQAMIDGIPWISQMPPCENWQLTANCGPTSYLMIESFYKGYPLNRDNSKASIEGAIDWLAQQNVNGYKPPWKGSDRYCGAITTDSMLEDMATIRGGFSSKPIKSESMDILRQEIEANRPVIVRVPYQRQDNTTNEMKVDEKNECLGHYMLLVGMEGGIEDGIVKVNDPGRPFGQENNARYKEYTLKSFLRAWGTQTCKFNDRGEKIGYYDNLYNRAIILSKPLGIVLRSLSLPDGKLGVQYDATLSTVDGLPPYKWTKIGGNLPDGIDLTQDGRITGTPTREGNFIFTIRVIDSGSGLSDAIVKITVSSAAVPPPLDITTPRNLPIGQVNIWYDISISAAGGKWPYTYSRISGSLPDGLSLTQGGKLFGTPSSAGAYTFDVQVADSSSPQKTIKKEFVITILPSNRAPVISSISANQSTVPPNGTATITCYASDPDNDPLTYSWSATGGSIPGSNATATWTAPSTTGVYTVTCTVSDNKSSPVSKGVNISVTESTTPLSITTTSLPSGTVGVSYPATNLSATGGKTPYTWSWSGNTPPGLSLSTGGIISGTPTTAGTYNFTIQVKDSSSPQQSATANLSITVNPANTPTVTSVNPGNGTQGQALSVTITGANFTGATSVSFGSGITVNSYAVNSSTQITANISISSTATTGSRNVSVTTPAGTGTGNGLFTVTAPTVTPYISSVSPNPVTGSNSSQPFTINGGNFVSGATVTLRDLRTGEVFPNRPISSFSSTQIVINPIFTTIAATWTVEVINPGGASSGQFSFQVVAP